VAYTKKFTDTCSSYAPASPALVLALAKERWTSCTSVAGSEAGYLGIGGAVIEPQGWVKTLSGSNGWLLRVHMKFSTAAPTLASEIIRLQDTNGALVWKLERLPSGVMRASGAAGFTQTDGTTVLAADPSYHKFDIGYLYSTSAGAGRLEVRANGTRENALTSSAFSGGTLPSFSVTGGVVLQPVSINLTNTGGNQRTLDAIGVQHDSAVWADTSGLPWLGTRNKFFLLPSGVGTYNGPNWVANGDTTLPACVDEVPEDGDATYASNNTVAGTSADRVSFAMQDLPSNTTDVAWVALTAAVRGAPINTTVSIKQFLDQAGTIADGAAHTVPEIPLSGAYVQIQDHFELDPSGATWTKNRVNSIQAGELLVAVS